MAHVDTNLASVALGLGRLRDAFGLDAPGRYGKTFEGDARRVIAEGNYHRYVLDQEEPSGSPLAPLAESTLAEKRRLGYPDTILVRTGLMLSMEQLEGEAERVDRGTLEMTYGTTEQAKLEMEWATEGSEKQNRPDRPGYDIDAPTGADLEAAFTASCDEALARLESAQE